MKRETNYWVKRYGETEWEIAYFYGNGRWDIAGFVDGFSDADFEQIDPTPITRTDKNDEK